MRLLIISLLFLFITNIVCPPKKHSRDSPKEDFDPTKRRSVSGSDTGTGTGTSNPDATTSTGVPSSQGEQQTDFFGLEESFGNNPFLNQQQQPPHVVGSSFQTFDYPSDISDYYNQPIFSPPREYWKQADQTGQVDYPTTYQPTFTPLPFSHQSDSFIQLTPLFVADDSLNPFESQQEDQTSKQAGPKSQLDPKGKKDKIPKSKGRIKDRANRRVVALGYTPQEINFEMLRKRGHFMGHCNICKKHGFSSNFFVTVQQGVENCVDQHVNSEDHQYAMKKEASSRKAQNLKLQQTEGKREEEQYINFGEPSQPSSQETFWPSSERSQPYAHGSQPYAQGSEPFAHGSQPYAHGSHYIDQTGHYVDPITHVYGSVSQQFGSGSQRGQGSRYPSIEYITPEEQHEIDLATQASLNLQRQNRPQTGFQIRDQESAPANQPQQPTQRDSTKSKGKAQRKH
uniref:Uncharacterized protein n=1 Tax=Meloidogyne enterolobii TaxID=390850 RepID=A0A6V7X2Q2_MELEN|nr:unnamed protein product [Meloidogyne enterolobii]